MEPRKNIRGLLNAYRSLDPRLRRTYPLALAGADGWGSDSLALRKEVSAAGEVTRLGYVPDRLLPDLYSGAACFVYPSFYD